MTITLQAVNELIQSLESAGELSIKETKVMALAKAYLDVAAENAELKEDRDTLARYWIEDGGDEDCAMSYCEPTPATDRIVAGIKAEAKSHDLNAFISHYSAELDAHIESGGDQFDAKSVRLRSFIVGGRMFREKLRDEEKALALREGAK